MAKFSSREWQNKYYQENKDRIKYVREMKERKSMISAKKSESLATYKFFFDWLVINQGIFDMVEKVRDEILLVINADPTMEGNETQAQIIDECENINLLIWFYNCHMQESKSMLPQVQIPV